MMYMHYCKRCCRIHMLNGHKAQCPKCSESLTELKLSYLTFSSLDLNEREALRLMCQDEVQLKELSTTYRMFKYSKWYKQQQQEASSKSEEPNPKKENEKDDNN